LQNNFSDSEDKEKGENSELRQKTEEVSWEPGSYPRTDKPKQVSLEFRLCRVPQQPIVRTGSGVLRDPHQVPVD